MKEKLIRIPLKDVKGELSDDTNPDDMEECENDEDDEKQQRIKLD